MKHLAILSIIALAACQEIPTAAVQPASPAAWRDPRMQPDGTCRAQLIAPSWVDSLVPAGSRCPVPHDSMRRHADGSRHDSTYPAVNVYTTWRTADDSCNPRAWAISDVQHFVGCLKAPPRYLYDTAGRMSPVMTWGL